MQNRIFCGSTPSVIWARVIRTDGMFIKEFNYDERCKGTKYFEKWINDNMFNIEGIDDSDKNFVTYWVS